MEYLLGALAPGEAERLHELSVTDDEFAERLQAVEYDLVDAYVRGELTGDMLGRFQSFYLSSPKRRERVQFAQGFRRVAEQKVSSHRAAAISRSEPRGAGWRLFTLPRPALQWGLAAAAVALVTVASWLAVENQRLRGQRDAAFATRRSAQQRAQELEGQLSKRPGEPNRKAPAEPGEGRSDGKPAPTPPVILAFNLGPQMRGASQMPAIMITAGVDYITLQLELEAKEYSAWRAIVRPTAGKEPIWRSGRLSAYARDDVWIVPLSFPPRLLETRVYIVQLSGVNASGSEELIASYPFRVIRK